MKAKLPIVLSIAGTDPSGGAGIHADIKAISATGAYAAALITALVAQNTQGVRSIYPIPASFVKEQLDAVTDDLELAAIKIGMVHDKDIIIMLAEALKDIRCPLVIDPVMVAKDGSALMPMEVLEIFKEKLLAQAFLITPNKPEAEALLGYKIENPEQAALALASAFRTNILLKGGHFEGQEASDILYDYATEKFFYFKEKRIESKNTHGTGCTLSAALASYLAQGMSLEEATKKAKAYLHQALLSGSRYQIGQGQGPVDHFYFLHEPC